MIRIEPLEKTLPKDWRRTVREHPWLSLTAAVAAGVYLGRNHGRQLLAAVVSSGLAFGVESVRGALGLPSARPQR
ncbi:MAG: hypothetical protein H7X85_00180 [Thermoanaerobaculia bacterium]|nr:hypothetical protein [Thermoanaerobaculia bacterium]